MGSDPVDPKALAIAPWMAVMQDSYGPVINLYEAAEASVEIADGTSVEIIINGEFPFSGDVNIIVTPAGNSKFAIKLRMPTWSKKTKVAVNGQDYAGTPGSYLSIERIWNPGDVIKLKFDMSIQINEAPDGCKRVAFTRGPIVLAQDSRIGNVDTPISTKNIEVATIKQQAPKDIFLNCILADGTELCDYASAGNKFSENNKLCVWMKRA